MIETSGFLASRGERRRTQTLSDEPPAWTRAPQAAAALARVVEICATENKYEEAIDGVAVELARAFDGGSLIALISDSGETLHPLGLFHVDPAADALVKQIVGMPFKPGPIMAARVFATGKPVVIGALSRDEVAQMPAVFQPFLTAVETGGFATVPLDGPTGRLGIATIAAGAGRQLTEDDVTLIERIADVLSLRLASTFLSERLAEHGRAERPRPAGTAAVDGLTRRERDILKLIAEGYTNKEMAASLVLSVRTVEWHRSRLVWKLGTSSRVDLTQIARAAGLRGGAY